MRWKITKETIFLLTFALLLTGCGTPDNAGFNSSKVPLVTTIINNRTRDFRTLFRPAEQIEEMENKRVCRIQVVRHESTSREIVVGNGTMLDKVIAEYFGKAYDGQVKVISRDAIIQTPTSTYAPETQKLMEVHPGDLIIILGRD